MHTTGRRASVVLRDIPMHVPNEHRYIYTYAFDLAPLPSTHTCDCFIFVYTWVYAPNYKANGLKVSYSKALVGPNYR